MKPGKKEMNTLLRNKALSLFFFKAPIRSRSPLLTGPRLISLPLATQMFQFAKFEKSKERRLATELGYGFPIKDSWITDSISPWPFASESVKERSRKGQNRIKTGQKQEALKKDQEQNRIKTRQKREAWRSRERLKAVAVDRARKNEENKKE
nr:putative mitochondrial protein [Tanacetum cinerariifolium]